MQRPTGNSSPIPQQQHNASSVLRTVAAAPLAVSLPQGGEGAPKKSLFDPGAPSSLLNRHPLLQTYVDSVVETEYIAFISNHRLIPCVLALLASVLYGPVNMVFYTKWGEWMAVLDRIGAALLLVAAVVGYFYCRHATAIGRRLELLHHVILFSFSFAAITRYPFVEMCRDLYPKDCTLNYIDPYVLLVILIPLHTLTTRAVVGFVYVFCYYFLFIVSRSLTATPVDTNEQFGLTVLLLGMVTAFTLVAMWRIDRQNRAQFEVWVQLRRSTADLANRQSVVAATLRHLLPESVLANIKADRPLVESSELCAVGAFQIFDFGRWTWNVRPGLAGMFVASMVAMFDASLRRFDVSKLRVCGDLYVVSCGLRNSCSPATAAVNATKFGLFQQQRLATLAVLPSLSLPSFAAQTAVGSGQCCAGFVGLRSLWYEGFGAALDTALALLRLCPPNNLLICATTRQCSPDSFAGRSVVTGLGGECDAFTVSRVVAPSSPHEGGGPALKDALVSGVVESSFAASHSGDKSNTTISLTQSPKRSRVVPAPFREASDAPASRLEYLRELTGHQRHHATFFDASSLEVFTDKLRRVRPHWWDLRFPHEELQQEFEAFCRVRDARISALATIFSLWFLVGCIIVTCVEFSFSAPSLCLLVAAFSLAVVRRVLVRSVAFLHLGSVEPPLTFSICYAVFLAALADRKGTPSLLSNNLEYFFMISSGVAVLWIQVSPWWIASLSLVLLTGGTLLAEYSKVVSKDSMAYVICPLWMGGMIIVAFLREADARKNFEIEANAKATEEAGRTEWELQCALLQFVVPSFAMEPIAAMTWKQPARSNRRFLFDCLMLSDMLGVLLLDFGPLRCDCNGETAGIDTLREIERRFLVVDDALSEVQRHPVSQEDSKTKVQQKPPPRGHCYKVRTCGDEALLGGPITLNHPSVHGAGPAAMCTLEEINDAINVLLDVMNKVLSRASCTAVLCCSDGIVALVGESPPIVDIVGPVMRTARAMMDAAPRTSPPGPSVGYMAGPVGRILSQCNCSVPRHVGDLRCIAVQRWRLRDAGIQYVSCFRPSVKLFE